MASKLSAEVKGFVKIAQRYCEWAETTPANSDKELQIVRHLLAKLHLAVQLLPDLGIKDESISRGISHETWGKFFKRFSQLPIKTYWDAFDPLKKEKPILNNLADDLADIYKDIKEGLLLFEDGNVVDAVWEWRFDFQFHWGQHLTGAQRAIHHYFAEVEVGKLAIPSKKKDRNMDSNRFISESHPNFI